MKKPFVLRFNDGLYYRAHYSNETGNVAHKLEDASHYAMAMQSSLFRNCSMRMELKKLKPSFA